MKLKLKTSNLRPQSGFTLIELLVVISILGILATVVIVNFAGQRDPRNLKIAQSQLVTDIRKVQSYSLSGKILPNGQSAQFYLLKINSKTQYTIEAIYNVSAGAPKLVDVSTVTLPPNIVFTGFTITRTSQPNAQVPSSCVLTSFSAPFGKIFFNSGCSIQNYPTIDTTNSADDYNKILEFSAVPFNTDCTGGGSDPNTPPLCTISSDSSATITLGINGSSLSKTITVDGINGVVTFN